MLMSCYYITFGIKYPSTVTSLTAAWGSAPWARPAHRKLSWRTAWTYGSWGSCSSLTDWSGLTTASISFWTFSCKNIILLIILVLLKEGVQTSELPAFVCWNCFKLATLFKLLTITWTSGWWTKYNIVHNNEEDVVSDPAKNRSINVFTISRFPVDLWKVEFGSVSEATFFK